MDTDKEQHRKGRKETDLFAEGRKTLLPLPAKRFDVVTCKRLKDDRYDNVLEVRHQYAAGPEHAGREMIVGLRALEIKILDAGGVHVITPPKVHQRRRPVEPARTIVLPSHTWPNSRVCDALPDSLHEWIESAGRGHTAHVCRRSGTRTGKAAGNTP